MINSISNRPVQSVASEDKKASEYWDWFLVTTKENGDIQDKIYMKYHDSSTEERPKMYVETIYDGKKKTQIIDVNSIDPKSATGAEMYALLFNNYGHNNTSYIEKLRQINGVVDKKGILKKDEIKTSFYDKKLNFVQLLQSFQNMSEKETYISDSIMAEMLALFAFYPKKDFDEKSLVSNDDGYIKDNPVNVKNDHQFDIRG